MRIAAGSLSLLCAIGAAQAYADDPPYYPPHWYTAISGSVVYLDKQKFNSGFANDQQSYDYGYGYSVAGGVRLLPDMRWELEVSGRQSDVKHDPYYVFQAGFSEKPAASTAIMTNAYYDMHTGSQFVPYLGAGIGDSYVETSRTYGGSRLAGWALSYQFMTGVSYEFDDTIAVNLGYRYVTGQDVKANLNGADIGFRNTSNNIEAGIRFFLN